MKIEKKLWKTIDNYKVFLVDGGVIRKTTTLKDIKENGTDKTMADFLDYAIHSPHHTHDIGDEFSQVPENEIWIAKDLSDVEKLICLLSACRHLDLIRKGEEDSKAYDKCKKIEKEVRHALEKGKDVDFKKEIYTKLGEGKDRVIVWIIDGEFVRDKYDENYIQGGHGYVYDYVPKHEIWLDCTIDRDEFHPVLVHEYTEMRLMRDEKMPYEKAHEIATTKEYEARDKARTGDK